MGGVECCAYVCGRVWACVGGWVGEQKEEFAVLFASVSIISSGHIQSELRPECLFSLFFPFSLPPAPGDPCAMEMIRVRVP